MSVNTQALYSIQSNGQDYWLATANGALIAQDDSYSAWQITDCLVRDGLYYIYDQNANLCLSPDSDGTVSAVQCSTNMRVWNVNQRQSSANDGSLSWYIYDSDFLWLYVSQAMQISVMGYSSDPNFEYTLFEGSGVTTDLCSSGNLATATDTSTPDSTQTYPTDSAGVVIGTTTADFQTTTTDDFTTSTDTQTDSSGFTTSAPGFDAILSQLSTQTVALATIQTPAGATVIGSSRGLRQVDFGVNAISILLLVALPLLAGLFLLDPLR